MEITKIACDLLDEVAVELVASVDQDAYASMELYSYLHQVSADSDRNDK
jgi:hypothetical protein